MYNAGKKTPKALEMKKNKAVTEEPTKTTEQATPKEQDKPEVVPHDEDEILYCDTDDDSDASLPDPFAPKDPKKPKTLDTKEDQAEDTAIERPEVMDTTDMPELLSDEEEGAQPKQFTFKKPTGNRTHHK